MYKGNRHRVFDIDFSIDKFAYYDECNLRSDGRCVSRLSADFARMFDHPGVYAITDPLTDVIVYVGRSERISSRFQSHLIAHQTDRDGVYAQRKNGFIKDVLASGQKPGLVVLHHENAADAEAHFIGWLIPLYNKNGHFKSFIDSDERVVRRLARWHEAHGADAKRYGYSVTPYDELWEGFRRHMKPY